LSSAGLRAGRCPVTGVIEWTRGWEVRIDFALWLSPAHPGRHIFSTLVPCNVQYTLTESFLTLPNTFEWTQFTDNDHTTARPLKVTAW